MRRELGPCFNICTERCDKVIDAILLGKQEATSSDCLVHGSVWLCVGSFPRDVLLKLDVDLLNAGNAGPSQCVGINLNTTFDQILA